MSLSDLTSFPHDLPIIDVSPLFQRGNERRTETVRQLIAAHTSVGFSILVGHGMTPCTIQSALQAGAEFHSSSLENKFRTRFSSSLRGYLPLGASTLKRSTLGTARRPNHSESFVALSDVTAVMSERWADSVLGGTQTWPSYPRDFEAKVKQYRAETSQVARVLISAFEQGLKLRPGDLADLFDPAHVIVRLLHYPALPSRDNETFGSAPHTDYGCLTLVAQDNVGGLQVQAETGRWIDVPPIEGALVLNTGQIMQIWTGGRVKATPHRVINHPTRDRNSIAFFYDCALDTVVQSLVAGPCSENSDSIGRTYGEHLEALLTANYAFTGRSAIWQHPLLCFR